jgi:hypothetical protein
MKVMMHKKIEPAEERCVMCIYHVLRFYIEPFRLEWTVAFPSGKR